MASFEVIVLGVGDAFSEKYHPSALLLVCDGFHLAIDCPDMYRSILRSTSNLARRHLSISDIDDVLITHVHGDHMNGLEAVAFYKHFVEGKRVRLATSPEVREVIWDQRLRASMSTLWDGQHFRPMGFEDYFDYLPLPWSDDSVIGPFKIRTQRTLHHVPTSALLIEAAGRTVGYSSDTAFDRELISFLEPADLIIHETNFGPAHTPYSALAALPGEVQGRLRLIHYPDALEVATSGIPALREGEIIVI